MQTFVADISTGAVPQILRVKQGDSMSRFFRLTVTDGSEAWQPPEGVLFTVRFATGKSSGWYDTIQLPGGGSRPAVEAQGNVLTVEVAMQATTGDGELCVVANAPAGYQLAAWNIQIRSELVPGADSPEAEDYYGVLAEQIGQVAQGVLDSAASAAAAAKSAEEAKQSALVAKGHTIQDGGGASMPQRANLRFSGALSVVDSPSDNTTYVSPISSGTQNVAGYVGEISLFADNQLRENHVWADGSTINPATWPDLAAYAATAGWETDSSTGWYKTPNLQGCFLLPSSSEHAVNTTGGEKEHKLTVDEMPSHSHPVQVWSVSGTGRNYYVADHRTDVQEPSVANQYAASTGGGQPHNNMPPYYVVTAQIRAKVDIIEATAVEVNGNTLGGFEDGQVLAQQGGKLVGQPGAIKTFVGVGNLGLASGSVTTAQVFDAMPEGSTALINSTNVSDPPDPYGLIIVHKISSASGQATFYRAGNSAVAKTQQMYIKQGGGGLSGVWAATSTVLSTSIVNIKSSGMVEANGSAEASVSFPAVSGASAYVAIPQACNFGIITALSVSGTNVTGTLMNLSGDSHTLNAKVLIMALG